MIEVYLIRHGLTEFNKDGVYAGRLDFSLCSEGVEVLKENLNKNLYPQVDYVYTSPLKRCLETSKVIYEDLINSENFEIVKNLTECDFGDFEGKSLDELMNDFLFVRWANTGELRQFPNGEEVEEFHRRCENAFVKICNKANKKGYKKIAIVAHGGVLMAILDKFADKEKCKDLAENGFRMKNGEGYCLNVELVENPSDENNNDLESEIKKEYKNFGYFDEIFDENLLLPMISSVKSL